MDVEDYNAIRANSSTEEPFTEIPFGALKVINAILKSIRCLIGSQCSVDRTELMLSYFLILVRTLAAAFSTICSLFIKHAEQ